VINWPKRGLSDENCKSNSEQWACRLIGSWFRSLHWQRLCHPISSWRLVRSKAGFVHRWRCQRRYQMYGLAGIHRPGLSSLCTLRPSGTDNVLKWPGCDSWAAANHHIWYSHTVCRALKGNLAKHRVTKKGIEQIESRMDPFKRSAGVEVYRQVRQCCYWIQGCEAIALKPESKVQLSETSQSRVAPPPFGIFLCDIRMLSTPALLGGFSGREAAASAARDAIKVIISSRRYRNDFQDTYI